MRIYRRFLITAIIIISLIMTGMVLEGIFSNKPENIWFVAGEESEFDFSMPYSIKIESEDILVSSNTRDKIPASEINIDLDNSFSLSSSLTGSYTAKVYLFNLIPVDTIEVNVVDSKSYYIGGELVGIVLNTDGVLVLGTGTVTAADGTGESPANGILKSGDYIRKINGQEINDKEEFISMIQENGSQRLTLTIYRNNSETEVSLKPVLCEDDTYKIGAWVRDDTAGVGTLTYIDPATGEFGALGHGITDVDTGTLMNIYSGEIYTARALSINKGVKGNPGEIVGSLNMGKSDYLGSLTVNSNFGITGQTDDLASLLEKLDIDEELLYEIAYPASVKKGEIRIASAVLGSLEFYSAEITEVNYNNTDSEKAFKIKVTDERLIEATGGIVQGMSGSPILQNGRLIGAVTHVTVDDPKEGYGIFIETMLEN